MATINPNFKMIHESLSEIIGNAQELPYEEIKDNLHALVGEMEAQAFLTALEQVVPALAKRVTLVEEVIARIPNIIELVAAANNAPTGLKEDLLALSDLWHDKKGIWENLKSNGRHQYEVAFAQLNDWLKNIIPFLLDSSSTMSEKKEMLKSELQRITNRSESAGEFERNFNSFAEDISAFCEQWKEILEKYWPADHIRQEKYMAEHEMLIFTCSDLSEKTFQLSATLGLFPVSSGVASALSTAIPTLWVPILVQALGRHVPTALAEDIIMENGELAFEITSITERFRAIEGGTDGKDKLHVNVWYCNEEVGVLSELLSSLLLVWTSLIHDITTFLNWSIISPDEVISHVQVTQSTYSVLYKLFKKYESIAR